MTDPHYESSMSARRTDDGRVILELGPRYIFDNALAAARWLGALDALEKAR